MENCSLSETVVLCGAGFLGSWWTRIFSQRACALHFSFNLVVIDMDQFEERNIPTQFIRPRDVGKSKALLSAEVATEFGLAGHGVPVKISMAEIAGFSDRFSGAILVVDTFDNLPGRLTAKRLSQKYNCPCLHLSMSEEGFGKVEWHDKWSLDPDNMIDLQNPQEITIDPCELIAYQALGISVATRGAVEAAALLSGELCHSWTITTEEQTRL